MTIRGRGRAGDPSFHIFLSLLKGIRTCVERVLLFDLSSKTQQDFVLRVNVTDVWTDRISFCYFFSD